jgi:hypothetical protein
VSYGNGIKKLPGQAQTEKMGLEPGFAFAILPRENNEHMYQRSENI